jgi:hypothetical protein
VKKKIEKNSSVSDDGMDAVQENLRVEKFPKISTKTTMSVFPRLLLFYRFFGYFSAMGEFKNTTKKIQFYRNSSTTFVFVEISGIFRRWESSKTLQKKWSEALEQR